MVTPVFENIIRLAEFLVGAFVAGDLTTSMLFSVSGLAIDLLNTSARFKNVAIISFMVSLFVPLGSILIASMRQVNPKR